MGETGVTILKHMVDIYHRRDCSLLRQQAAIASTNLSPDDLLSGIYIVRDQRRGLS